MDVALNRKIEYESLITIRGTYIEELTSLRCIVLYVTGHCHHFPSPHSQKLMSHVLHLMLGWGHAVAEVHQRGGDVPRAVHC